MPFKTGTLSNTSKTTVLDSPGENRALNVRWIHLQSTVATDCTVSIFLGDTLYRRVFFSGKASDQKLSRTVFAPQDTSLDMQLSTASTINYTVSYDSPLSNRYRVLDEMLATASTGPPVTPPSSSPVSIVTVPNVMEFAVGVPQNKAIGTRDGSQYYVFYNSAVSDGQGELSYLTTDFSTVTPRGSVVSDVNNDGRAFNVVYGLDGSDFTAYMLSNHSDAYTGQDMNDNSFTWRSWVINPQGELTSPQVQKDAVTPKRRGWAHITPNLSATNQVSMLYGAVSSYELTNPVDSNAGTRTIDSDFGNTSGLGGYNFTGIKFPETNRVLPLTDGLLLFASDNGNVGDPKTGPTGVVQEATRLTSASSWGTEVTVSGNVSGASSGAGDFTDQSYATNSSHAGQIELAQTDDGRVYCAYVSNEDPNDGDFGRIRLVRRGGSVSGTWSLLELDVASTSVPHIAMTTDGNKVWLFYAKLDGSVNYKVFNPQSDTLSAEVLVSPPTSGHTFNRMFSSWRFPKNVQPAVAWTEDTGSGFEMKLAKIAL